MFHKRSSDWFLTEGNEVMSWLGKFGAYSVADEEAFKRELRDMFGNS